MGLLVDIPKAELGNTNDGSASRRFFSDPDTYLHITEIKCIPVIREYVI